MHKFTNATTSSFKMFAYYRDGDIRLYVDANMLRDEFKKDPVTEKTMGAALQSKLAKLINEPGQKLTSFNDFVLKVDAGTC